MSEPDGPIPIRSYRVCFDLERRIHRVDQWRIPVAYGLPLRGIAYAALALVVMLWVGRLPLVGPAVEAVHPALRLVVVPCLVAMCGVRVRVAGRSAHAHLAAALRQRLGPGWVAGFRPVAGPGWARLGDVRMAGDGRSSRLRPARIAGPCRLAVRYPATARRRGRRLVLRQTSDRPLWRATTITVPTRARVTVR